MRTQRTRRDPKNLGALPFRYEPDDASDLTVILGDPRVLGAHASEMLVKVQPGTVAADGRVVIEATLALG